jgi:hypothetical protein
MRNRTFISVLFLVLVSCQSLETKTPADSLASLGAIAKVSLGDSRDTAIAKAGAPGSTSHEKYPGSEYETLEYSKPNGLPMGYLTIDPLSKRVVAKSFWISDSQPEHDISYTLKRLGSKGEFEEFRACDKHFEGKFKVDRKAGLFIGIQFNEVAYLSWSDPRLTELRIEDFRRQCPEMQKQ